MESAMQLRALALSTLLIPLTATIAAPGEKPPTKTMKAAPITVAGDEKAESEKTAPAKPGAFFIEAFGGLTFAQGTMSSVADGQVVAAGSDVVITNKSQNASGFGGGAMFGYDIAENLSLTLGGAVRSVSGRKFSNQNGGGNWTQQSSNTTVGLMLGIRPWINALGGRVYAGAGWLVMLPFTEVTEWSGSSNGTSFTSASDGLKWEDRYNLSLKGMYGELGVAYEITDNLFLSLGARAFVATSTNIDQTRIETKVNGGTTVKTTTTYREGVSQDQIDAAQASSASASDQKDLSRNWTNKGITDITLTFALGYRF